MPPFDGAGMYELPPTRIFFDGGLASQTIDQNDGVEPSDVGLSEDRRQRRKLQAVVSSHEYITASTSAAVRCVCTDGISDTLCMGAGSENAWIMFDLGEPMLVKGVEIVVFQTSADAPSPPPAPPPRVPPSLPPEIPLPPRPPPIQSPASPPPYPAAPPRCNYLRFDDCIVNFIDHTNDGICDGLLACSNPRPTHLKTQWFNSYPALVHTDSGVVARDGGLIDASTSICRFGHDFSDCGERCDTYPPPNPPPPPHPPPPLPPQNPLPPVLPYTRRLQGSDPAPLHPPPAVPPAPPIRPTVPPVPLPPEANPGALEVWASDVSSFFGYKTATLQNGISSHIQRTPVDYAYQARYWSIRSYNPDARLRLDSLRFYGMRSNGDPPIAASQSACEVASDATSHPPPPPPGNDGEAAVEEDPTDRAVYFPGLFVPPPTGPPPPSPSPPPPSPVFGTVRFLPGRRLSEYEQAIEAAEREEIWKRFFQNLSYPMPSSRAQLVSIVKYFFSQDPATAHFAKMDVAEWPRLPGHEQWDHADEYEQPDESTSQDETPAFDMDSLNWWNNLEVHTLDEDTSGVFNLYPLRLIPNTVSISPAASLVTALALTNASASGEPDAFEAESRLLESACRRMGGCEYRSREAPLLQSVFETDHPRASSTRDDGEWAAWTLSATISPVVSAIVTRSLMCASKELCGELCDVCDGIRPPETTTEPTPTEVVRAVETALVGGGSSSVDVVACTEEVACVAAVAEQAAAELGTIALPMPSVVEAIAASNKRLWDSLLARVVENATSYANFTDRMREAMDVHFAAVGSQSTPLWARKDAASYGRRLQDEGKRSQIVSANSGVEFGDNETRFVEWFRSISKEEQSIWAATASTAQFLMDGAEHDTLVVSHMHALQVWAWVGAHVGTGANHTGVCADPHIPNRTISCRAYFALVGREVQLGKRRADNERALRESGKKFDRRRLSPEHHRQLKESVESHLDDVCCAEFESDGRIECGRKYCEHHVMRNSLKRMGHVLRKLNDDPNHHPAKEKITPDVLATLENYILPELHEDPQCREINRSTLDYGGPTRWECMGKSLLKHAAKKHGLDAKTVEGHMKKMGLSVGRAMQSVHRVTGVIREVRGSGNVVRKQSSKAVKLRNEGAKRATELLRSAEEEAGEGRRLSIHHERALEDEAGLSDEELARRQAVTRGTVGLPGTRFRGFAHSATRIAAARRERKNSSRVLNEQFRRLEEREHRDRLERAAAGRAAHARRDKAPHYESFHWDNFKQHIVSPVFAFEALQAEHGSLSSRLRGGLSKLSALSEHWQGVNLEASLVDVRRRRQRQRRLAESEDGATLEDRRSLVRKLYDELDSRQAKRAEERRRKLTEAQGDGRRLSEEEIQERIHTPKLELPARHTFSFLHELVDWGAAADEWNRVKEIVHKRNQMRYEGRSMKEILEHHPTGYSWLDDHARYGFTKVGDAFRRMWHRKTNGTDAGHVQHVKSNNDRAGSHHPEKHGRVRRLAESFLGPAVSAPYALWDTKLFPGTFNEITVEAKPTQDNIFVAALRYIVFSTVGCYLTEPKVQVVGSQKSSDTDGSETGDGTKLKVLRPDDTWMCFPAIPLMLPRLPTWREFTKSEGVDYTKLTYEVRACNQLPPAKVVSAHCMHAELRCVVSTGVLYGNRVPGARARLFREPARHAGHLRDGSVDRHPWLAARRRGDRLGAELCGFGAGGRGRLDDWPNFLRDCRGLFALPFKP
jgi:hypothetical protein